LVILDEAHAAMDQSTVVWWLSLLESVKKYSETSIILVSHDLTPSVVDLILTLHPAKTGSTATVVHL
jgi:ABC-type glutathione transport system ATPase component